MTQTPFAAMTEPDGKNGGKMDGYFVVLLSPVQAGCNDEARTCDKAPKALPAATPRAGEHTDHVCRRIGAGSALYVRCTLTRSV
jgi:hypothetical protein